MAQNLTTLANVKAWVGATQTGDDAVLTSLIGSASRLILSYLQRPSLFQASYTEILDGKDTAQIMLRNYPVLSISSLVIDAIAYSAIATPLTQPGYGYVLEPWNGAPPGMPQLLTLRGACFNRGNANVQVQYNAGYAVQNEAQTIPATPYQITVAAPYGNWAVDQGVTYAATGVALAPVASNPAAGQYSVAAGVYTFAAADAGKAVLVSYSYVPFDIEQACIEIVTERYRYRDRIGQKSKSIGGQETVTFDNSGMSQFVTGMLAQYKRMIPI